jgi:hypothetical protein
MNCSFVALFVIFVQMYTDQNVMFLLELLQIFNINQDCFHTKKSINFNINISSAFAVTGCGS